MLFNKFGDLSKRVSISIGVLGVLALLIFYAANPIVSVIMVLTVSTMAGIGVWEYAKLASTKGLKPTYYLMVIIAMCEVIAFFIALLSSY